MMILILAFQLHCGAQQIGSNTLSYGTLVYSELNSEEPKLAYFEENPEGFQEHSFCQKLRDNMNSQAPFAIELTADGKKLIAVQTAHPSQVKR